jgi:hypothetical protein
MQDPFPLPSSPKAIVLYQNRTATELWHHESGINALNFSFSFSEISKMPSGVEDAFEGPVARI